MMVTKIEHLSAEARESMHSLPTSNSLPEELMLEQLAAMQNNRFVELVERILREYIATTGASSGISPASPRAPSPHQRSGPFLSRPLPELVNLLSTISTESAVEAFVRLITGFAEELTRVPDTSQPGRVAASRLQSAVDALPPNQRVKMQTRLNSLGPSPSISEIALERTVGADDADDFDPRKFDIDATRLEEGVPGLLPTFSFADVGRNWQSVRNTREARISSVTSSEAGDPHLNQYALLSELGRGSQGIVHLAFDEEAKEFRAVKAVKKPLATSAEMAQLKTEVDIMKRLRHRNIVTLYEVINDPTQRTLYLVMQYVESGPLVQFHSNKTTCNPIDPFEFIDLAKQMTSGLRYLHSLGIFHRDLKPENVLRGDGGRVYLSDFGVSTCTGNNPTIDVQPPSAHQRPGSRLSGSRASHSTHSDSTASIPIFSVVCSQAPFSGDQQPWRVGTPAFFAPEIFEAMFADQRQHRLSLTDDDCDNQNSSDFGLDFAAVDVWALGMIFYVALVGVHPFLDGDVNLISLEDLGVRVTRGITAKEEAFPSVVPREWRNLILGMLALDPTRRLTLEAVKDALKAMNPIRMEGSVVSPSPASSPSPLGANSRASSRSKLLFAPSPPQAQEQLELSTAPPGRFPDALRNAVRGTRHRLSTEEPPALVSPPSGNPRRKARLLSITSDESTEDQIVVNPLMSDAPDVAEDANDGNNASLLSGSSTEMHCFSHTLGPTAIQQLAEQSKVLAGDDEEEEEAGDNSLKADPLSISAGQTTSTANLTTSDSAVSTGSQRSSVLIPNVLPAEV